MAHDKRLAYLNALGTSVDLVTKTSLKPSLRPFVEKDAIVVD